MKFRARRLARAYVELVEGKTPSEREKIAAAFVTFLAERHELSRWREILRGIDDVWKEKHGVANVVVSSAHPLSKEARRLLEKATAGATLEEHVDPALIGGAHVRIDDRVIDASIAGYLSTLSTHLLHQETL